ncbi:hypothetical protein C8R44DRAFT_119672 [Mycena epipterygia]|nr:hypothetical protein C8R44DRAFT_119672 [Mycena epipterygia]
MHYTAQSSLHPPTPHSVRIMLLKVLPRSMSNAEDLRKLCATTPEMNSYQPIAASAVEVCAAAMLVKAHKAEKLAAHVVDRTAVLVNGISSVPLSQEIIQSLEIFEQKLDAIRRHIEQMPVQSGKKAKFSIGYKVKRESSRLKAELENHLNTLLTTCGKSPASSGISRSDCILELASLSTRTAGAICEAPVLNFLKPAVGLAALICDTAKSVKSNRDAALDLAKHASTVTKYVVERASRVDGASIAKDGEALEALKLALEDIHSYLTFLQIRRRRITSWILANEDKERFAQLNAALDKALAMFSVRPFRFSLDFCSPRDI